MSPFVSSAAISPAEIAERSSADASTSVARVGVEPRQLAVGPEPRQLTVEVVEELPARERGRLVAHDEPHRRAHAVEADVGHDDRVVSGACGCGAGAAGAGAAAAGAAAAGAGALDAGACAGAGGGRGRRAARPVLDDPRDDHAPLDHLAGRRRSRREHHGLTLPDRRVRPGPHLEPESRRDREEQPERARDHRKRPGLLDRRPRRPRPRRRAERGRARGRAGSGGGRGRAGRRRGAREWARRAGGGRGARGRTRARACPRRARPSAAPSRSPEAGAASPSGLRCDSSGGQSSSSPPRPRP